MQSQTLQDLLSTGEAILILQARLARNRERLTQLARDAAELEDLISRLEKGASVEGFKIEDLKQCRGMLEANLAAAESRRGWGARAREDLAKLRARIAWELVVRAV